MPAMAFIRRSRCPPANAHGRLGRESQLFAKEYLVLSHGRDGFAQSFACTVLLGVPLDVLLFSLTRLRNNMLSGFSRKSAYVLYLLSRSLAVLLGFSTTNGFSCQWYTYAF
jgi:hypothetical protein